MITDFENTKAFFVSAGKFKEQFKDAKCALPISVGQQYHEGNKLLATIKLISSKFKSCDIIVCDSLQRHTIQAGDDLLENEAYAKSIKLGEQWLYRNKNYILNFTIPFKIIRWDQWLNSECYCALKNEVDLLFLKNSKYNNALITTSKKFIDRYKLKQHKHMNYNHLADKCIEYLKEECAITSMWLEEKYDFVVYPGKRTDAMMAVYHHQIEPLNVNLLTWIRINFKTRH